MNICLLGKDCPEKESLRVQLEGAGHSLLGTRDDLRLCPVCVLFLPVGREDNFVAGMFAAQSRVIIVVVSRNYDCSPEAIREHILGECADEVFWFGERDIVQVVGGYD